MSLLVSQSRASARPDLQSWSPRNVLEAEGTLVFLLAIDDAATLRALHREVVLDGGVTLLSPLLPPVGAPVELVVAHPVTGTLGSVAGVVVAREATLPMFVHVRVAWSPAARAGFEGWVDTGVGPAAPPAPIVAPVVGRILSSDVAPAVVPDGGRRAPGMVRLVDEDDITIDLVDDDGDDLDAAFAAVTIAIDSAEGAAE
jgi:hypothetical protein